MALKKSRLMSLFQTFNQFTVNSSATMMPNTATAHHRRADSRNGRAIVRKAVQAVREGGTMVGEALVGPGAKEAVVGPEAGPRAGGGNGGFHKNPPFWRPKKSFSPPGPPPPPPGGPRPPPPAPLKRGSPPPPTPPTEVPPRHEPPLGRRS